MLCSFPRFSLLTPRLFVAQVLLFRLTGGGPWYHEDLQVVLTRQSQTFWACQTCGTRSSFHCEIGDILRDYLEQGQPEQVRSRADLAEIS